MPAVFPYETLWGVDVEPGWHTRRDGGTDWTGEWRPGNSWTATRVLAPSFGQYMTVRLRMSIQGSPRSRRDIKPRTWYAWVELGNISIAFPPLKSNACDSIADAQHKADRFRGLPDLVSQVLKKAYADRGCVYRLDGDDPDVLENWKPWLSTCNDRQDYEDWPDGSYFRLYLTAYHGLQGAYVTRTHYSIVSGTFSSLRPGVPANDRDRLDQDTHAKLEQLPCWMPFIEAEEDGSYAAGSYARGKAR